MKKKAEAGASALLSQLLERVGDIVLNPENNQLEDNQELLIVLRTAEAKLREKLEEKSSPGRSFRKSVKRVDDLLRSLPRPRADGPL